MSAHAEKKRKTRLVHKKKGVGAPPGTLLPEVGAPPPSIILCSYDSESFEEQKIENVEDIQAFLNKRAVTWVDVLSANDPTTIKRIGEIFEIHPLTLEDVTNKRQRAKCEDYEKYRFIAAQTVQWKEVLEIEDISIILGNNFLLTFQERPNDNFALIRNRIRNSHGIIRTQNADYLAYSILDSIVDGYFPTLESIGEKLENLEDHIIARPEHHWISSLHMIKRDLLAIRRILWPLRDALNTLIRDFYSTFHQETGLHLRDCYDHVIRLIDLTEMYREVATDLRDVYLTSLTNRTNDIMRVLTVVATIFMPLTFITSIYGMNFDRSSPFNMPELGWYYGYPIILGSMTLIGIAMLFYFYKKGWVTMRDITLHEPKE